MPGWRQGGSCRGCSYQGAGGSLLLPASSSTAWAGRLQGSPGVVEKAELPPEPGLRSLCCGSFMVTARLGGKKKGGHQEIPALPPSFKTGKRQ